jgi:HAD superfamily hydrolase (TIGR01549 family)
MTTPRLALFDLDDTLSDRASGFRTWATHFLTTRGHVEAIEWMIEKDNGGYSARLALFDAVIERLGLHESAADLVELYQHTSHESYTEDPVLQRELATMRRDGWLLGIVTNGSTGQDRKIDRLGVRSFFEVILVSETVGVRKPDPAIFQRALNETGCTAADTWMIGDNLINDIGGAATLGCSTIWISHGRSQPQDDPHPTLSVPTIHQAWALLGSLR